MPKRKIATESKTSSTTPICDIAEVSQIKTTTNAGQLYTNTFTDNSDIIEPSFNLFMGIAQYTVKTKYAPLVMFNDYFMTVVNSTCG